MQQTRAAVVEEKGRPADQCEMCECRATIALTNRAAANLPTRFVCGVATSWRTSSRKDDSSATGKLPTCRLKVTPRLGSRAGHRCKPVPRVREARAAGLHQTTPPIPELPRVHARSCPSASLCAAAPVCRCPCERAAPVQGSSATQSCQNAAHAPRLPSEHRRRRCPRWRDGRRRRRRLLADCKADGR